MGRSVRVLGLGLVGWGRSLVRWGVVRRSRCLISRGFIGRSWGVICWSTVSSIRSTVSSIWSTVSSIWGSVSSCRGAVRIYRRPVGTVILISAASSSSSYSSSSQKKVGEDCGFQKGDLAQEQAVYECIAGDGGQGDDARPEKGFWFGIWGGSPMGYEDDSCERKEGDLGTK